MHGYNNDSQVQIFYKGVINLYKCNLDSATGDNLLSKGSDVAKKIIEKMVLQSSQWFNERNNHKKVSATKISQQSTSTAFMVSDQYVDEFNINIEHANFFNNKNFSNKNFDNRQQ